MQKSEFPRMRHYVGFSQIGSHMYIHSYVYIILDCCILSISHAITANNCTHVGDSQQVTISSISQLQAVVKGT